MADRFAAEPSGSAREGNPLAREHRPERLAPEDVRVEVRHFLASAHSDVGENAIPLRDESLFPGNSAHGADEAGDLLVGSPFREIVPGDV